MTDNWLFNFNKNSRKSENLNFYLVTFADTHEQFRLIEIFNCLSKYDQVIYSDIKQPFCILKISENTIKLIKRAVFVKNISLLLYVENLSLKYKNIEQNITNDIEKTTESHLSIFKHDNLIKNVINFSKYFNPKSCAGKIVTHKCYYLQRDDFFKALDPIISQKVDLKTPDLIYKLSVFLNDKSDLERTFFFSLDIGLFTIRKHILNLKIPDRLFIGRTTMDPEIAMWMYNMLSKNTNDFTEIKEQNSVSNDKWPINQLSQFIRQNFSISDIENVVIDPFCGSAGLLLLPSILNDFVIGSDINRHEMIGKNKYEICENKTLDENLKAQVDNFINLRSKSDKIHSYEEHCMLKFGSKEKTTNQKNKTLDQKEKTLDQKEKTLDHKEKTLDRKEKLELKVPEPLFFIQDLPGTRTCLQNTNVLSNFYQYNTSDKVISFFNLDIADLKQFFQNYEIIHQKNHLPIEKILNGLKNDIVNDILNDIVNDLTNDMVNDIVNDLTNDLPNDMVNDLKNDLKNGLSNDLPNDMVNNLKNDMVNGLSNDLPNDLKNGPKNYLTNNLKNDLKIENQTNLNILTDLPYGNRVPLSQIHKLLEDLCELSKILLKKGNRICFCTNTEQDEYIRQLFHSFKLKATVKQKLKRFVRQFYVYEKI